MFVNFKCIFLELPEKIPCWRLWTAFRVRRLQCTPPPSQPSSSSSCFFIIHFNTPLSPILRHKLRVVVQFSKTILLFRPSVCVLNIVCTPLLKHFVCTFVCWVGNQNTVAKKLTLFISSLNINNSATWLIQYEDISRRIRNGGHTRVQYKLLLLSSFYYRAM